MVKVAKNKTKSKSPFAKKRNLSNKSIKNFKIKDALEFKINLAKTQEAFRHDVNIVVRNAQMKVNGVNVEKNSKQVYQVNLRVRSSGLSVIQPILMEEKPSQVGSTIEKSLKQLIDGAWRLCKKKKKENNTILNENQIVLSKMKSYSPWPAKILSFTKNRKSATVYFYGTHNSGRVDESEIINFEDAHEVIRLLLLRPNLIGFTKGILEVEREMNVPEELSITNQKSLK